MDTRYVNSDRVVIRTDLVPQSVIENFYRYIDISLVSGCWHWTGTLNKFGYGLASGHKIGHKFSHRVSWVLYNGQIPEGMQVCHRCDNRRCCNPDHLFLGTAKDNAIDKYKKGRAKHPFGERNPKSKLTEEVAWEILVLHSQGFTSKEIKEKLNTSVDSRAIRMVSQGKNWKHIYNKFHGNPYTPKYFERQEA